MKGWSEMIGFHGLPYGFDECREWLLGSGVWADYEAKVPLAVEIVMVVQEMGNYGEYPPEYFLKEVEKATRCYAFWKQKQGA